jgi:tetratricopeptide (TPR) repeat protein
METKLIQCAVCGAEIDLFTMQCPYCVAPPPEPAPQPIVPVLTPTPPEAPAPPTPPAAGPGPAAAPLVPVAPVATVAPVAPAVPAPVPAVAAASAHSASGDRDRGLALFEAEECLARGAADKALVLASKIVKERPDNLTARALVERARRELLRGRRRERLEARVREAQALAESGSDAAAEKIVTSALKFVPDHPVALQLFATLRQRRLKAGTAEAEAEREIDRLAREQARRALEAARTALASGWGRKALLALRGGLRLAPDDPDLLALAKEVLSAGDGLDRERARRQALFAQVRAGLDRLTQGDVEGSLQILRAVLREDPDNIRAQAAVQEVRRVWLARQAALSEAPATTRPPVPSREPTQAKVVPAVASAAVARPALRPTPAHTPPRAVGPVTARPASARTTDRTGPQQPARATVPAEIMLPRSSRRATPIGLVLVGGIVLTLAVVGLTLHSGTGSAPQRSTPATTAARQDVEAPPATAADREPGPLARLEPELRQAIETTLQAYARALETANAELLAAARPDLTPAERDERLAPFRGALNAATDLRVLDVTTGPDTASVSLLSTDVIIGGRTDSRPAHEETLHYERKNGVWALGRR